MAEGIGPAVKSGLMAADAIAGNASYDPTIIERKSFEPKRLFRSWLFRKPYL
jgi:flavin-dependent dehydrogenase